MISRGDEYPLHQTSRPVRDPGCDRNLYDRFWFNGYPRDGSWYFGVALGQYPGRNVMDAAVSVSLDGTQHNLRASRRLGDDRLDTCVGPIRVEIVEPLGRLRVVADDEAVRADLTFTARARAIEEPHFLLKVGQLTRMDYTRLTQHGTWSGRIEVAGRVIELRDHETWATRDRSWGIRPVGEHEIGGAPEGLPQFFWVWAPLHFDDACTLFDSSELADGMRWHESATWLEPGQAGAVEHGRVDYAIDFAPGTRHASAVDLRFALPSGERKVRLEPLRTFWMQGLGYLHPTMGHGMWVGEDVRAYDTVDLSSVDPTAIVNQHVQLLCRAVRGDGVEGLGVFEQLLLGPHAPSGLTGFLDPAP